MKWVESLLNGLTQTIIARLIIGWTLILAFETGGRKMPVLLFIWFVAWVVQAVWQQVKVDKTKKEELKRLIESGEETKNRQSS